MTEALRMVDHAEEYLRSAHDDRDADPPRRSVAYENARTAAELAGKALLLVTQGNYPTKHAIGGDLYQANLIPDALDPKRVAHLLKERTRADYGFHDPVDADEMAEAITIAEHLVHVARRRVGP